MLNVTALAQEVIYILPEKLAMIYFCEIFNLYHNFSGIPEYENIFAKNYY